MPNLFPHVKSFKAGFLSITFLTLAATSTQALASIDTIALWDGVQYISSFGVTNTATYGQTVTVGANASPLVSYSFEIGNCDANVSFRGSVYAWDGTKATGSSLFTSGVQTVNAGATYTKVTFNVGSLSLPAGRYILFASTSQDQSGAPNSACRWGAVGNNAASPGGQFMFLNNGPDPAQWTTTAWSTIANDLAFQVDGLTTSSVAIPTLSEWGMIILSGLLAVGTFVVMRRRMM